MSFSLDVDDLDLVRVRIIISDTITITISSFIMSSSQTEQAPHITDAQNASSLAGFKNRRARLARLHLKWARSGKPPL
jgi:hypothetical protein